MERVARCFSDAVSDDSAIQHRGASGEPGGAPAARLASRIARASLLLGTDTTRLSTKPRVTVYSEYRRDRFENCVADAREAADGNTRLESEDQ